MRSQILLFCTTLFLFFQAQAQITRNELDQVFAVFHQVYDSELKAQNAVVVFNLGSPAIDWWSITDPVASYSGYKDDHGILQHNIYFFGGLAQFSLMSKDGAAQILCHEMGHAIGGAPYKLNRDHNVSIEPQADYFSTRLCLRRIFTVLPVAQEIKPISDFIQAQCRSKYSSVEDLNWCYRAFQALESERSYLRLVKINPTETNYETPDLSVVDQINLSDEYYPSPQCRMDTLAAGVLQKPRPRCWFAE
jgi:hypothetical protein